MDVENCMKRCFEQYSNPLLTYIQSKKHCKKNATKSSVKNAYTKTTKLTIVENKKDVRKKQKKNKLKDRNKFPKQGCLL